MAIEFARMKILNAAEHSAVAKAAYNVREKAYDQSAGITYDFRFQPGLIDSGLVLPADAPEWAADTASLWNAAQDAEYVIDRKTGERRLSEHGRRKSADGKKQGGPQVAKDIVLALPKELDDDLNRELLQSYIASKFGGSKVAVQWSIHREDGDPNAHAHILVSTRTLSGKGFGKKARELNPEFVWSNSKQRGIIQKDAAGRAWAEFQNSFFAERGMELRVDPTRIVPERHIGNARFVANNDREQQNAMLAEAARAAARDPDKVLAHATKTTSTFTTRDIERHLNKAGLDDAEREEVVSTLMASSELVEIGKGRFTTRTVIAEEQAILSRSQRLANEGDRGSSEASRKAAAATRTMTAEQQAAFKYATGAERFAVVQGRAGTGKSYTMGAIREAYERDGYRVVGLSPTNTVAADMRGDGFKEGRTVASELLRLDNGHAPWSARTVIMIDEMGMLSNEDMRRVLAKAEMAGAKIIGFGDDRQLTSVARGGMFEHVARVARAVELGDVIRQKVEYQKEASEAAARGDMTAAIAAYGERGNINWSSDLDAAQEDLVRDWRESVERQPEQLPFVYAATNDAVGALNDKIRAVRKELGQLTGDEHLFVTEKRGKTRETHVSVGDRIQFTQSVKDRATQLDLRNAEFGTIERVAGKKLTVRTDAGRVVTFDAGEQKGWELGYASTVYKSQGKTQARVMALHDSAFAWKSQLSYVALTRHKHEFRLYANRETAEDEKDLARMMGRSGAKRAALSYLAEDHHSGRLVAHGKAPYENKEGNRESYYVKLEAENGRQVTLWGVDLERAMQEAAPAIGDKIGLEHAGSTTVRLPNGKTAERNAWQVVTADDLSRRELKRMFEYAEKGADMPHSMDILPGAHQQPDDAKEQEKEKEAAREKEAYQRNEAALDQHSAELKAAADAGVASLAAHENAMRVASGEAHTDKVAAVDRAHEKPAEKQPFDRKSAYEAVRAEPAKPISRDERKALWGQIKGGTAERPDDEAAKRAERAEQQRTARPQRGPSWER